MRRALPVRRCLLPAALVLAWMLLGWALLRAGAPAAAEPGLSTITVGRDVRSYALERFRAADAQRRLPVIVFLHGSQTDIREPIEPRFDVPFEPVAGMEPALIVRPQGIDGRWAISGEQFEWRRRIWRWLRGRNTERPDEIAFLDALVAHLVADENGDPERVYVVGVSSGGFMTMRLACAPHQPFAAYAAVLATGEAPGMPACTRLPPVSLLLMASTTDTTVPYRGNSGEGRIARLSATDTVAAFVERDHCATRTETPLPHADIRVPSTVSLVRYGDCAEGREVLFYRVDGSRHSVPSKRPIEPGGWVENGARNQDIEAADVIWDFFRRQRLPDRPQNAAAR